MKCGIEFSPKSGASKKCDACRSLCAACGGKKSSRTTSSLCLKCASGLVRLFDRKCIDCGANFKDKNNKTKKCNSCAGKRGQCIDCEKELSSWRPKRCNSCSRKFIAKAQTSKPRGWRRYEFDGVRYRSKWEIEVAGVLRQCGVLFEYERLDQETKTRPDFWVPSISRYLEVHPDIYGEKKPVTDCVIVKSKGHAIAAALAIGFRCNPERAKEMVSAMKKARLKATQRWALDLCAYLRQAIMERDGR